MGITHVWSVACFACFACLFRSVAYYPAAIKEFSWRNGFFWDISKKAKKEGKADPCPLHSKLLLGVAEEQGLSL